MGVLRVLKSSGSWGSRESSVPSGLRMRVVGVAGVVVVVEVSVLGAAGGTPVQCFAQCIRVRHRGGPDVR
eukprot:9819713-Alexandrium_andersonii.AAC.1